MPSEILFRDAFMVVMNKPSGLLVHRGWDNDRVVAMTELRNLVGQHVYPVHRLDRGASGALAMALDRDTARRLHELFESGAVTKRYVALVRGITPERGTIEHAIERRSNGPKVPATTEFQRLGQFERYSLVEAIPRTGRLHQIRRHLKHLGHPLIGDANYGRGELNRLFRERFGLARLALHAHALELVHPITAEPLRLVAALPADLSGPLGQMALWPAPPPPA